MKTNALQIAAHSFYKSEFVIYPALFHNRICGVAGLDFRVNGKIAVCNWTVPYIMVALSASDEMTLVFRQLIPYQLLVFRHQIATLSRRSERNVNDKGALV